MTTSSFRLVFEYVFKRTKHKGIAMVKQLRGLVREWREYSRGYVYVCQWFRIHYLMLSMTPL